MNNKLLLVNGITLLYRESQLPGTSENSSQLVREIISNINLTDLNIGVDHERDVIVSLRDTALSMCDVPNTHQYEPNEVMQRLKVNTGDDVGLYEALYNGIVPELSEGALKRTCLNIRRSLDQHFREKKINEIMSQAAYKIKFDRNKILDMKAFVAEVCSQLEPYQIDSISKDPAIVSNVDFNNLEEIENVFQEIKQMDNGTSILKTGYQGINRMLDGGFRRGEEVVIGALQHKYKTGFSLSLFKQIALYNVPQMIDPTKKPLMLRISFEDDLTLNFQFLYQSLKENETGQKADLKSVTIAEMAAYVQERLQATGYNVMFLRVDPTQWTYKSVCNKILELEADGYEVHVVMLDYLTMLPTTGCTLTTMGSDIRDMYRRMRNFTSPRKITLITPHQLSTDAKKLIREGRQDFVKDIAGKGYYAGCQSLDNEVDLEMYIHIEILNGRSYLTVQRGKHRKIEQTDPAHLYCVLPFQPIGGILDDIYGPDTTCKKVGGGPVGSADENPFWEFAE